MKKQLKEQESEIAYLKGKVKQLTVKNAAAEREIKDLQQMLDRRKENVECGPNLHLVCYTI